MYVFVAEFGSGVCARVAVCVFVAAFGCARVAVLCVFVAGSFASLPTTVCLTELCPAARDERSAGPDGSRDERSIDRSYASFTLSATSDARSAGPAALAHSLGLRTS